MNACEATRNHRFRRLNGREVFERETGLCSLWRCPSCKWWRP